MNKKIGLSALILSASIGLQASVDTDELTKLKKQIKELKLQSDAVAEELLDIKTGTFTKIDDSKAHNGMGAAASKVYYSSSPLSIGGYGEMFIAKKNSDRAYADIYRFIPYFGYRFSDSVIMNAEIEIEHGNTSAGGKVLMEFLYLDFLLSKSANIRVGNLLVPVGLTNLRHEPTLFQTVNRPHVERYLIPSTWHENGVLVYGEIANSGFEYTTGIVNSLNVANDETRDNSLKWIRKGRLGSSKNGVFNAAFVGRLDYRGINGLLAGGSLYYGDGSNQQEDIKGTTMSMFELHALYNYEKLTLKALYTQSNIKGASKISPTATSKATGYYVNAAYDIGGIIGLNYKIPLFAQYENYNLAASKADGSSTKATNKYNVGFNFLPTPQTVLKFDYEITDDPAKDKDDKTVSASLGFLF